MVLWSSDSLCRGSRDVVTGATLPTVGDKTSLGPHGQVGLAGAGESLLPPYPTPTHVLSPVIHILGALETEHWRSIFNPFLVVWGFSQLWDSIWSSVTFQLASCTTDICHFVSWMGFGQCYRKDWIWREIASILITLRELEHSVLSGWLLTMDNSSLQPLTLLPLHKLPSSAMCRKTGGHGTCYRPPQDRAERASALWNGAGREEGRVTVVLALSGTNSHQSLHQREMFL